MEKSIILSHLKEMIAGKISDVEIEIDQLVVSRDSDTKSSAGDKHETSREMVQREIENSKLQLSRFLEWRSELEKVDVKKEFSSVQQGALVETNQGFFFFGIGLGKLEIAGEMVFAISLASPIGQVFHAKSEGERVIFKANEYIIHSIN